eukprot:gb/GECH01012342.1/.p1 GENE.gb/GECH01012342.1/~~gb/GECH01012342.1/.p1  ORF type:complete len:304 (+),score=39.89 gb/GECH01012342.1/:1-912(+)
MHLHILNLKGKKPFCDISLEGDNPSIEDLRQAIYKKKGLKTTRQYFYKMPSNEKERRGTPVNSGTLSSHGINDGDSLIVKDLGPQVSYQTVFISEYAWPFIAYPIFYFFPNLFYSQESEHHPFQMIALVCWSIHYAKRLLETVFVHRFSHATMPLINLPRNSSYYYIFAVYIAYYVNHPLFTPPPSLMHYIGLGIFVVGETCNLICHLMLRNLRPAGSKVRKIPRGFLFEYVSCPNYTAEISSWIGFTLMTSSLPAALFTLAGCLPMTQWALKKHKNYRKEFDGKEGRELYPQNRRAIIPFLL